MTVAWVKSTETYTNPDDSYWPCVMFGNTATGIFGSASPVTNQIVQDTDFAFGSWRTVDLTPFGVTSDAIAADIGGVEIITNSADLMIAFRAPGTTLVVDGTYYQEQLLSAVVGGGARSSVYDTVPLVNGCFQYCATAKNYPDDGTTPGLGGPNYVGWNLKLKKWHR